MKAPFFRVFIDNEEKRELSALISHFKYEDCVEEDDLLELRINADSIENFEGDNDIMTGTPLIFQFGYMGGESSDVS